MSECILNQRIIKIERYIYSSLFGSLLGISYQLDSSIIIIFVILFIFLSLSWNNKTSSIVF